jgi:hypothetical protein
MSLAITVSEVRDGFTTAASDADIMAYIAVVDQADACLTANGVAGSIAKQLKILGARHLASNASDKGQVTEEQSVSGARRVYTRRPGNETSYLHTLRTIDRFGCVMRVISNNPRVQLRSAGRLSPQVE